MGDPAEKIEDEPNPSKKSHQKRIAVVVEDSEANRRIITTLLQKMGFEVLEGATGNEGFQVIKQCQDDHTTISIIMSDIMMPEMDGFELLEKVKAESDLEPIPFIFFTALANKEDIRRAREMGANGYILKPIVVSQVAKKIVSLFPEMEATIQKVLNLN